MVSESNFRGFMLNWMEGKVESGGESEREMSYWWWFEIPGFAISGISEQMELKRE